MQLNKYLAYCGVASRRAAVEPIKAGKVRVNGRIVYEPAFRITLGEDEVLFKGKRLAAPKTFRYVLLNKPASTMTTMEDDRERKTVIDLLPPGPRIFPVGRLDYDTEGALLLTNDGDLAYRLAHPRYQVSKIYRAWVRGVVTQETIERLHKGVRLIGGPKVSGDAKIVGQKEDKKTRVEIKIHEGRKHQVKRMLKAVGHPVSKLERVIFAGLTVKTMPRGSSRELTRAEVSKLYKAVGLKQSSGNKE
ncbi:rRNA pseudouridine synthase [bacterium]|nr:rRNA pseudouridine synthase [bacterium]